jgi:hypothetical protein
LFSAAVGENRLWYRWRLRGEFSTPDGRAKLSHSAAPSTIDRTSCAPRPVWPSGRSHRLLPAFVGARIRRAFLLLRPGPPQLDPANAAHYLEDRSSHLTHCGAIGRRPRAAIITVITHNWFRSRASVGVGDPSDFASFGAASRARPLRWLD